MQEWISGLMIPAAVLVRWWCGRAGRSAAIGKRTQAAGANAGLLLAGCGIYLLAEPLWSDAPAAPEGIPAGSSFPVSLAATLLVLGVIFGIGLLFNRNKPSSC